MRKGGGNKDDDSKALGDRTGLFERLTELEREMDDHGPAGVRRFLPGAAIVIDFVFLGVASDNDLAVEGRHENGEFIPGPIHLPTA